MKVAVLDLGSLFAKIFKTSTASPSVPSQPGGTEATGSVGSSANKSPSEAATLTLFPTLPPDTSASREPSTSLHNSPGTSRVPPLAPYSGSAGSVASVALPSPRAVWATLPSITIPVGSTATEPQNTRQLPGLGEQEPSACMAPAPVPKTLFFTLPDIGEEWASDSDSQEDPEG